MSVSAGRRLLMRFCGYHLKSLPTRSRIARFSSAIAKGKSSSEEESTKINIPVPEPDKICAAVLRKCSSPLVLENLELPKISQDNEVLIDVQYCALNASDVLLAQNLYTFEPSLPMVLGYELVGKLVEVGKEAAKRGYKKGDKVIALNKDRYGGLAEQCIAEVSDIWRVLPEVKSLDAVSILDNYVTALVALERKVSLQEEDIILINVGISSIGLAAVDIATNVFLAQVISVCATEDGAALAREKGVLASLKFKDRKLLKQLEEVAAEKDIKAIFEDTDGEFLKQVVHCFTDVYNKDATMKDLLRDDNFAVVVHHLSREGRVIIAGTAKTKDKSDSEVENGGMSLTGFNLQEYRKKKPEKYRQAGDEVLQFFEEGLIKPTRSLIIGMYKVNDALEFILKNKSAGKVIIDIKNKEAEAEEAEK